MENVVKDTGFYNIKISDVKVNGKLMTKDKFNIELKNSDEFIFE